MDIHKPKPFHGWREFLKEYGIIVLGVLTALSLEQAVEALHWHHAVEAERRALNDEVSSRLTTASARLVQEPCIQNRLKELQVVFERHKNGESLGLAGPIGVPAVVTSDLGVWTTAVSGQTIEHMPEAERREFGNAFSGFANLDANLRAEEQAWDELGRLDDPEILETGDWPALRAAYSTALASDRRNRFLAEWTLKYNAKGQRPDAKFTLEYLTKLKTPVRDLCRRALASND